MHLGQLRPELASRSVTSVVHCEIRANQRHLV